MNEIATGQERLFEVPEDGKKHDFLKRMSIANESFQKGKLKMEVFSGFPFSIKMEIDLGAFERFMNWVDETLDEHLKSENFTIVKFEITGGV